MKYDVIISDKEKQYNYSVEVKVNDKLTNKDEIGIEVGPNNTLGYNNDPNMTLEISRAEYEHTVKRLDRLDNKVYILLTVCSFLFVMLTSSINNVTKIKAPDTYAGWMIVIIYIATVIGAIILMILLLRRLIGALSSTSLLRLDSTDISDFNMALSDKNQVARYVIGIYEHSTKKNNELIEKNTRLLTVA